MFVQKVESVVILEGSFKVSNVKRCMTSKCRCELSSLAFILSLNGKEKWKLELYES